MLAAGGLLLLLGLGVRGAAVLRVVLAVVLAVAYRCHRPPPRPMYRPVHLADTDAEQAIEDRARTASREIGHEAFKPRLDPHRVPEPLEARQFLIDTLAKGGHFNVQGDQTLIPME